MGKMGMDCGKDMYYDRATGGCAYCSELCHLVDIQGTREECVFNCPGYLATTTATSSNPWTTSGSPTDTITSTSLIEHPLFISFLSLVGIVLLGVTCYCLYKHKSKLIKKLKKQECCGDGTSHQPHVQETGTCAVQQEAGALLANVEGFPDMPNRSLNTGIGRNDGCLHAMV